jgi:hypothetical protein
MSEKGPHHRLSGVGIAWIAEDSAQLQASLSFVRPLFFSMFFRSSLPARGRYAAEPAALYAVLLLHFHRCC